MWEGFATVDSTGLFEMVDFETVRDGQLVQFRVKNPSVWAVVETLVLSLQVDVFVMEPVFEIITNVSPEFDEPLEDFDIWF